MRVLVGMVHDFVTGIRQRFDLFWILIDPFADDKESRFDLIFRQDIHQRLRLFVAPRRVKADGNDFVVALHVVNG